MKKWSYFTTNYREGWLAFRKTDEFKEIDRALEKMNIRQPYYLKTMNISEGIFATHKCCACGKPVKNTSTGHVNLIQLERKATWKFPSFGNVLLGTSGIAAAIVCDPCLESKAVIKWAIELQGSGKKKTVVYHEVDQLQKIEPSEYKDPNYDPDYDICE